LKKYGDLGLGLETQSLGLGLDKKVLFTSLNICNVCKLSFTVLPDFLISFFLILLLRFYLLYAVFVMVVLPFGVIKNNNNNNNNRGNGKP